MPWAEMNTYIAGKVLVSFIYPFNLAVFCFVASWLLLFRKNTKAAWRFQTIGLLFLLAPATGHVSEWLLEGLESVHPPKPTADYPEADAVVVLGGTTPPVMSPRLEAEEMHGARLQAAARLYKAGKADLVVVSGGTYRSKKGIEHSQAEDMRDVLMLFGVPESKILMEAESRNTVENARMTAALLEGRGKKRILLSTSAYHQPRATALFRKLGLEVTPVPNSFLTGARFDFTTGFVPDPTRLVHSHTAIKEYVGQYANWLFGTP